MDCIQAARDADPEPQRQMFHSRGLSTPATT